MEMAEVLEIGKILKILILHNGIKVAGSPAKYLISILNCIVLGSTGSIYLLL